MGTKWRVLVETLGDGSQRFVPQYRGFLWLWYDGEKHSLYDSYRAEYDTYECAIDHIKQYRDVVARNYVVESKTTGVV
ncbi:hypothetical protein fHeYen301_4 [Yersinia phage fHe-Yen3-01]|uniref:Uncharacterized protein n=1 Tax=Yersinia phage fHe-Yen3-01 TaxID=1932893 RepID=A0A1L7DQD2_9CAUD|nr:hypothetical protein HOR56_gp04 [Yersinia phage fHe-Yen3-01]APU00337.1 hypothetical protein fHeYen301_4 [Yersinia phage fHe-Yen3-01]